MTRHLGPVAHATPSLAMQRDLQALRRRAGADGRRAATSTPARWSPWSATTAPASPPWSRPSPGSTPRTRATIEFDGQAGQRRQPRRGPAPRHRHRLPGPRPVRQPRRRRQPLPRPRARHRRALDEVEMEQRSPGSCCASSSAKIPSVRIPVASLSGGQRQTVAIARSLLGEPKVVMLDEPTAALGVAQTAEVLNLVERLRERGLGVILISHNMADVMAVADRVAVLRLGRNNGVFDVSQTTSQEIIAAITGATDNAVSQRARTSYVGGVAREHHAIDHRSSRARPAGTEELPAAAAGRPAGRAPDRLARASAAPCRAFTSRLRSGDLGSLPVVVGLVIIWAVFQMPQQRLPVRPQPRQPHAAERGGRHHRHRHRAGAAARRDRPVGRLGQRAGRGHPGASASTSGTGRSASRCSRRSWPAPSSGCSTASSSPGSACPASSSPWPGCSASSACSCRSSARRGRSTSRSTRRSSSSPSSSSCTAPWPTAWWSLVVGGLRSSSRAAQPRGAGPRPGCRRRRWSMLAVRVGGPRRSCSRVAVLVLNQDRGVPYMFLLFVALVVVMDFAHPPHPAGAGR